MKNILTKILLVIFTAIFLFSGYQLLKIFLEYHAGTAEYSQAADQYVKEKEDAGNKEPVADLEEGSDTCPIEIDFASLQAENPDVVGWIYSPDTVINYPVMKGETNDTYLHTMLNGQYNSSGSIFMDYRNNPDLSNYVTILYGHHMKNGSMFASLHKYSDQTYFEEHSYIWYLTPQGNYRINVISGFIENAVAPVYGLFEDEESFREFVDYAISKSDFQSRYDYSKAEHLMVLSTCSYEYEDARYIIVGIPIPEGQ